MIKQSIARVVRGENLDEKEMEQAMAEILTGKATPAQTGALLVSLRIKGETEDEICGAVRAIRARGMKISLDNNLVNIDRDEINVEEETVLDTCGTGGDGTKTFNVSTATAFVAAGGGVRVAKHGNRAVSGLCGSADVVEGLGVNLDLNSSDVERCIREIGIGFIYSPLFQGAMKFVAAPRREIGLRTIFNLMGPLLNPAGASVQVMGVYAPELTEKMARVLHRTGTRESFVFCGEGTFDEISICGPTRISHLKEGRVSTFEINPEDYGIKRAELGEIRGGNARKNTRIIREILDGERGPRRDMVLLNAGAAFVVSGLNADMKSGIERAKESIDSGRARDKLHLLVRLTTECRPFIRKEL